MNDGEPELNLEVAWNTNQIVEMIHIMQILIFHNEATSIVTSSNYIVGWFKFMSECKFFEQIDLVGSSIVPCQFASNSLLVRLWSRSGLYYPFSGERRAPVLVDSPDNPLSQASRRKL